VRFGFISYILPTQIIDVRKDPLDLMREMRKGHKSDIRRAEKFFHDFVLWREKDDQDLFFSYMKLHEKAAGRKTRPEETFAMMYSWIQEGNGALFGAELNGRPVSFAYVNLYKECAYYSSACNDPEIQNLPLAHFVQWSIIKWLHDNGYRYYEIGWQFFAPTPIFPASEKEIAISRFKRGFGGITVPIVFSERFITRRGFLNTIEERMLNFSGFQEEQPHFTQYYEKRIA
jgi:lipid II:glycine glycyltransferase (peptidoglycan interpeptide bridge formation enzyme)